MPLFYIRTTKNVNLSECFHWFFIGINFYVINSSNITSPWGYKISLVVLKKCHSFSALTYEMFSTLEKNFCVSLGSRNALCLFTAVFSIHLQVIDYCKQLKKRKWKHWKRRPRINMKMNGKVRKLQKNEQK